MARVIVLTQACDLAQGKRNKAVVAVVHEAQWLVDQGILKAQAVRDQVRRGQTFGWGFLQASSGPVAFPESIVDLGELHTISVVVLQRLIDHGRRACRLVTPYREHLAQHFGVTYMRIGLPEPFQTAPEPDRPKSH